MGIICLGQAVNAVFIFKIPYDTKILFSYYRVDRAENILRSIGVTDVRVRDYNDTARIEVCQKT